MKTVKWTAKSFFMMMTMIVFAASAYAKDISADGWRLVIDEKSPWEKDNLYLPKEALDMSNLPCNPPTQGWGQGQ